jgi:hypothetical protein
MLLRKVLFAAIVAAPLAWSAAPVSAQERGLSRADASTAQAEAVAGWTNNRAANRPTELPAGISNVFGAGATLPPGIRRTFPVSESEDECSGWTVIIVDGAIVIVDCNGNVVG